MPSRPPPRDLGALAPLDEARLEAGVILWRRFCVVGAQRSVGRTRVVTVTDLERELGDPEAQHRLDLHLLPDPVSAEGRARLERALVVCSHVSPRIHAIGRADRWWVVAAAPCLGRPVDVVRSVDQPPLPRRELLALGTRIAALLAGLHAAEVRGIRFALDQLRHGDGDCGLDGFAHLFTDDGGADPADDARALVELLDALAGVEGLPELGLPDDATALHAKLVELGGAPPGAELAREPPFVGRDWALAELGHGLDQAQIAQPTAIVVRGQRGVGKSRLLQEFVATRLAHGEALVLFGAWQQHSADSRGGLRQALEQLPQAIAALELDDRDDIRRRIHRATRHLGAIVTRSAPSLGAVLRNVEELPPLELGEDFSRHTAVIADLLRSLGTNRRPLVLVLDNVESIDASSAAVLKILSQRSPAHHTLIVMGLRAGARFEPELDAQAIELAPLGAIELEQLLTEVLPGEVEDSETISQTLWSVSGGLPLAAWTNLRAWVERGRLRPGIDDGRWRLRGRLRGEGARLEVYDVFGSRLAAASAEVRKLALRIAVLGVELDHHAVAALCALVELDVDQAITTLVDAGILSRTASGLRFPHDSIREFVFETFDERERRAAHGFAAELLERQRSPVAQIAYHRDLALDPDASPELFDRLSRLHVEAGRERLTIYDLERARWHLERALEHSRDPDQRNLAAEGLADVCLLIDDVDTAVSLYTAIIATSEPAHAVSIAAKAVLFLFSKSANTEARLLAMMALEVVDEPRPRSAPGKLWALFVSMLRLLFVEPKAPSETRDVLCRLYLWLTIMSLVDDPLAMPMFITRARWLAKGLESGPAAIVGGLAGSAWAAVGGYRIANRIFSSAEAMAKRVDDAWALGFVTHSWAHVSLLPSDRYEEGQDMLDDAIAAYRETGDVSVSVLSIMFKGLYGRDREHADKILGWFDEATATSRRNGKFVATASIEALRLHVMARQGRMDLDERLQSLAEQLADEDMTGIERLMARIHLAYAAYEARKWPIALAQIHAGQAELGDLPGVPEYCQEIHLVTALVLLQRPQRSRADRKLLRHAIRRFRRAVRHAPRLAALASLLDLEVALHRNDRGRALAIASEIVADFSAHENLHVARRAHLALSRLLLGTNIRAAAEHDRVARNLGRRLGLHDRALLSDFTDTEEEVGMLGIELGAGFQADEPTQLLPGAGMLQSAVHTTARQRQQTSPSLDLSTADVLQAWALGQNQPPRTLLGDILPPIREAVAGSAEKSWLQLHCTDPDIVVLCTSGDLQLVIINLLFACRDSVGASMQISARFGGETILTGPSRHGRISGSAPEPSAPNPGFYLAIEIEAPSPNKRVPVITAFATCDRLVQTVGGRLRASVDRQRVTLRALIPAEADCESQPPAPK